MGENKNRTRNVYGFDYMELLDKKTLHRKRQKDDKPANEIQGRFILLPSQKCAIKEDFRVTLTTYGRLTLALWAIYCDFNVEPFIKH